MQNMYLSDDGVREAFGRPPIWRLDEVVTACAALLAEARSHGMSVIYSRVVESQAALLRNLAVSRLIVGGSKSNVCVEATVRSGPARNVEVAVAEDAVSTDGPDLRWAALSSMRVLSVEVAPWREPAASGASWDRAFTTPDYGRNPEYWTERPLF